MQKNAPTSDMIFAEVKCRVMGAHYQFPHGCMKLLAILEKIGFRIAKQKCGHGKTLQLVTWGYEFLNKN